MPHDADRQDPGTSPEPEAPPKDPVTPRDRHEEDPDRDYLDHLWWSSKRWVAAFVVAAFPLIFVIDERVDLAFSPVLPGLVVLALVVLLLPFGVMELRWRRLAKKNARWRHDQSLRGRQTANAAFIVAMVWLLIWLALGA